MRQEEVTQLEHILCVLLIPRTIIITFPPKAAAEMRHRKIKMLFFLSQIAHVLTARMADTTLAQRDK
jgi:hypothetical protein